MTLRAGLFIIFTSSIDKPLLLPNTLFILLMDYKSN